MFLKQCDIKFATFQFIPPIYIYLFGTRLKLQVCHECNHSHKEWFMQVIHVRNVFWQWYHSTFNQTPLQPYLICFYLKGLSFAVTFFHIPFMHYSQSSKYFFSILISPNRSIVDYVWMHRSFLSCTCHFSGIRMQKNSGGVVVWWR